MNACPLCNKPPWNPSAATGETCNCSYEEMEAALRASTVYAELLEGAARLLVKQLDECDPHIASAFYMAHGIRGGAYTGPQYGEALKALRAVLERSMDGAHAERKCGVEGLPQPAGGHSKSGDSQNSPSSTHLEFETCTKPTHIPGIVAGARRFAMQAPESLACRLITNLADEIMRLRERLEIGYAFNTKGERIACDNDDYDGIYCRDETIKMLEDSRHQSGQLVDCPECNGTGWIFHGNDQSHWCHRCHHEGKIERHQVNSQTATVLDPPMFGDIEKVMRRRGERLGLKHGGHYYVAAADAIRDLRVALASQIEISNDLRRQSDPRPAINSQASEPPNWRKSWYCGRCDEDTPTNEDGKCPVCTKYKVLPDDADSLSR